MEGCGNIQREGEERTITLDRELISIQEGGTSDFNQLINRPSYNGERMTGNTNIPEVPTAVSQLTNDSDYQTGDQVESTVQQAVGAVSDDLADEITAREQADTALNLAIGDETTARQLADTNLQGQIDAITASSDVKDIVGTKAELNNYDTSTLGNNDIIKVLQDESEGNATTYYRWSTTTEQFTLIGEEGPYYTKSQADALLNAKQNTLTAGSNVQITGDTISATDTTYTAGNGLNLTGTEFSADTSVLATQTDLAGKQNTLTAGTGIDITNDVISATGGGGGTSNFNDLTNRPSYDNTTMTGSTSIPKVPVNTSELTNDSGFITSSALPTVNDATLTITQNGTSKGTFTANDADDTTIALTDTTYSDFTGTDGSSAGTAGLVPAPAATDAGKFLKSDGTWDTAGGGGGGVTVVQTPGTSTTDVMSQNATTSMVFADPATQYKIKIGAGAFAKGAQTTAIGDISDALGNNSVALGHAAQAYANEVVGIGSGTTSSTNAYFATALGAGASVYHRGSVALGSYSTTTGIGQVNIGPTLTNAGYNSTNYRLLTGLYDPQNAHDAANKQYVDAAIAALEARIAALEGN